ncbi:MAG: hypothetical protein AB7L84_01210 [Acidimicrobiia bacterium]
MSTLTHTTGMPGIALVARPRAAATANPVAKWQAKPSFVAVDATAEAGIPTIAAFAHGTHPRSPEPET